ncbi:hypothetical protein AVEN_269274-1 [Araneus ventricosus]|uniref:Uncharacterized protein n=1 Tax=Araneus ventricosus TaxID=182803 RepID=A0A4Y2L5P3_ARAVE|nr:hypothetical protein AVEN_269274-1 [Araneus ventricosus]
MAARNGPNAVEGQLKRKPNEAHSRTNGNLHSFCTAESKEPVSLPGAKIRRWVWICDNFVTDLLKPNDSSFSLTYILVLVQ